MQVQSQMLTKASYMILQLAAVCVPHLFDKV